MAAVPSGLPAQDRDALRAAEALARRDSLDPLAHYELALLRLQGRHFAQAEASLRTAVRLDPRLAVGWLALSMVRERDRDYWRGIERSSGGDSAVAAEFRTRSGYYRRAFLLDPLVDITVLSLADPQGLGIMFDRSGGGFEPAFAEIDRAWQAVMRAGSPDSAPPGLLWLHGMLSLHTNRLPMAILDMTALLNSLRLIDQMGYTTRLPLAANEVRYVLAAMHQRAGNSAQAIALYGQVLEQDVGNYMAMVQLAGVHESRQEWTQAIRFRRAAITTNPEDPTLRIDLAETLLRAGDGAAAESVLVEAAPDLMREPRLYYVLGRVLWALGRRDEAGDTFQTFLGLAPTRWAAQRADAQARIAQR